MSSIVGIDPDTKAITGVGLTSGKEPHIWRIEAKGRRAEDRIEKLFTSLRLTFPPDKPADWVYIETPVMGVNVKALRDQAMVIGMIRYWLWSNDQAHSMVDNGTWKKGVLGNGHASKEEIAAYAQRVLHIPADQPQDVYDAACIAAWGVGHTPELLGGK